MRMCRLLLPAAIWTAAMSASAEPLTYPIRALDPVVLVSLDGDAQVTYTPPLLPTPYRLLVVRRARRCGRR